MTASGRSRREWRTILIISVVSAIISPCFAYFNRSANDSPWHAMLEGVATSIVIATPLLLFELKGARVGAIRQLRRLPIAVYLALRVLIYVVVIVGSLLLMRFVFTPDLDYLGRFDVLFRRSLMFSIGMAVMANLVLTMGGLLGFGTLVNLLTGRYVQPKSEKRVFLLIDLRDSTGMAERLGPVRFHELLNDFFRDVTEAALECDGEIHKYVGDEAILTWSVGKGNGGDVVASGACLECPFIARANIEKNRQAYLAKYGAVPTFRAAIHAGEIVAGEIGDVRREIAYVGDTLNVAARLLEAAKTLGRDVLASADILERAKLPAGLIAEKLPMLSIRGREAPLAVAALAPVDSQGRS